MFWSQLVKLLDELFILKICFAFQSLLWLYANSKVNFFSVFGSISILMESVFHWICMLLWAMWHFSNISFNSWMWVFFVCSYINKESVFFICMFFSFFFNQCFIVFSVEARTYSWLNVFLTFVTAWMHTENTRVSEICQAQKEEHHRVLLTWAIQKRWSHVNGGWNGVYQKLSNWPVWWPEG